MAELFIPNASTYNAVTYAILINGSPADPSYELQSLVVTREFNRIPMARVVFRDGDPSRSTFPLSDKTDFAPGTPIQVNIGRDGKNVNSFKGIIVKHSVRVKENGNGELILECRDEAIRMAVGRHSKYYTNIKDSALFDQLIQPHAHLQSDLQPTSYEHPELVQHHLTDWDFMLLRAEANAMLVNVIDGKISIRRPTTNGSPVLEVNYGSSLLEFEAEMDARTQWKSVEAKSWDYHDQQLFKADTDGVPGWVESGNITATTLAGTIDLSAFELRHSGYLPEQELKDWVDGQMLKSRIAKICGRAKCTGFAGIKPGDVLKISGVGARFTGNVLVTAVRQEVGSGSWDSHIQFGLDPRRYSEAYPDLNDRQAAGLMGGIRGLQIGVTVKLEGDPEGQDRIQVKLPTIDNNASGIWTRMASLDAGNKRGAFFRPEVGDEVIVGFINDDPREAVVLGMLNSSAKPAPLATEQSNDKKGFTTRSGMHVQFDDGAKKITIDTPAGNSIVLDESSQQIQITDQQQNQVTMDTSGITVQSNLSVSVKAGTDLSLSAGASLSISAPSISLSGDAQVSMSGAALTLSAQGVASISGTLVNIN
ncbi:MAG TPA: type VI secretion system tip protein VgrG [Puia sp.]|uniref:type VI secretion system tip protein VgrG n=1 Tax=Puia sp. TaxID=2045100 RepID=UPI002BF78A8E|nr:type VI secretion system tip protein VgrG [Puia sp.]HVU99494.1 type VI secretion system tip protein VgrG [Puia sp.]